MNTDDIYLMTIRVHPLVPRRPHIHRILNHPHRLGGQPCDEPRRRSERQQVEEEEREQALRRGLAPALAIDGVHRHELVGQQGEGRQEDDGVFQAVGEDVGVALHVEVPQQNGGGRYEQHEQEAAEVRGVGKVLHVAAAAVEELEQQRLHGQEEHQEQGCPLGQLAQDERGRGLLVQLFGWVEARHPVVRVGRDASRQRINRQVEVEALFLVGRAQSGGAAQEADFRLRILMDGGARQA